MIKYRLHWSKHPSKDQDWYINECSRMSEDEIARELDINYSLSVSGKVFAPFREDRHTTDQPIKFNKHRPVYRIWDFGKTNCTLYAQVDTYGRKRLLHERILGHKSASKDEPTEQSNIDEQIRVAESDSVNLFPNAHFIDICDPAGSYEDQRGATPEVETLWKEMKVVAEYDRIIMLPTKERKARGRTLIMRDLQSTPGGQEALLIYSSKTGTEGCPILKKAFLGGYAYRKDANGNITDKIKEPNHPYEDVMDCLIYLYLQTDGYSDVEQWDAEPIFNDPYKNPFTGL